MRRRKISNLLYALTFSFLLLLAAREMPSQVTTAAIHGTVTDPNGAVVPSAKITALDAATGIATSTTSNKSGYFVFPALQIGGPYELTIEAAGFQKTATTGIVLTVNANLEENSSLKMGTSLQTVNVNASSVQVETSNTQLEQEVPDSQLENLPMLSRDAASLERLAPGVVESSDTTGAYSVNGSQTQMNSYQLEGIDINDGPLQDEGFEVNPDALAELNVVSSTINPEFARNSGSVVNEVVKSGTNQIHGSAFEEYRDTFMNLGGYFALPGERVPYHRNFYGGTVGAPIVKNRLFGFAAYQGYRRKTGEIEETPIFQSGVFSSGIFTNENNVANGGPNGEVGLTTNAIPFAVTVNNGGTVEMCGPGTSFTTWAACFPGSKMNTPTSLTIAPTQFNSVASALTKKYVPATANAGTLSAPLYNFPTANTGAEDQGLLRADFHISDNDSIYGIGLFQSSPTTDSLPFGSTTGQGANLPGFGQINAEHLKLFSGQETHTFNSNTLNVLRAGYYRLNFAAVEPANIVAPSSVGFSITPQSPSSGLPVMALTGLFNLGSSSEGPQPRKDTNLSFSDNFSHIVGNHALKVGVTIEQFRVSNPFFGDNNGVYSYSGAGPYSSGDPGIDFLLGIPDSYLQESGGFIDDTAWEYYAYAQDSWRVTSDLTINYGIGWDVETPNENQQYGGEGVACFQVSSATSKIHPGGFPGLLYPGDPGCNTAGGPTAKYDHFGPGTVRIDRDIGRAQIIHSRWIRALL
jgi:Carboxypeptidase regulatory-like domain